MAYGTVNAPAGSSFNGRTGDVMPKKGDYTPDMVGAVPVDRKVNGKSLTEDITLTAEDVGARPSDWNPELSDIGAVSSKDKGVAGGIATLDESGKVPEEQLPSIVPYIAGTTAPADRTKLWIDTTANTGGLKYHNGSAWVHVPVGYT